MANGGPDGTGERPAWLRFDDVFVDEVKRALKACQVFLFFPLYWIPYNQLSNNMVSQAATMELHGVPNDVVNNLDPLALIIFIPICDQFVYPWLARSGIRFGPIRRIFFGFITGTLAMVWCTVLQYYIYKKSPTCGRFLNSPGCDPAPINVWAQTGAYVLIAFSEIFASITGLEYAFTKSPKSMKSLVLAVFYFTTAIGNALSEAMNPLAADPHFIWNYGAASIIAGVASVGFWICFKHLDHEEDELNLIGAAEKSNAETREEILARQQREPHHQQQQPPNPEAYSEKPGVN